MNGIILKSADLGSLISTLWNGISRLPPDILLREWCHISQMHLISMPHSVTVSHLQLDSLTIHCYIHSLSGALQDSCNQTACTLRGSKCCLECLTGLWNRQDGQSPAPENVRVSLQHIYLTIVVCIRRFLEQTGGPLSPGVACSFPM